MNLVWGHDDTVRQWVENKYDVLLLNSPSYVAGIVDADGVLCGAFDLVLRSQNTVELGVYGRTSNDTVREMFEAVFACATRLEVRTHQKRIARAATKFGFKFQGIERDYYAPGINARVYYMTPEMCRWIDGQPVQKTKSADAA